MEVLYSITVGRSVRALTAVNLVSVQMSSLKYLPISFFILVAHVTKGHTYVNPLIEYIFFVCD